MGDDQHGRVDLRVEIDERLRQIGGPHRVEPRVGLVAQNDLRIEHERPRQPGPLPHAARYLPGQLALGPQQPDDIHPLHDDAADLGLFLLRVLAQREGDVVEEVHRPEERTVLEHQPEELAGLIDVALTAVDHVDPIDEDASALRLEQPDQGLQEHGLARTGRTEHDAHLAGGERECHVLPDVLLAKGLGKAFDDYFDSHLTSCMHSRCDRSAPRGAR